MHHSVFACLSASSLFIANAVYADSNDHVPDQVITGQNTALAQNTNGKGFGPQSPRDLDGLEGANQRLFQTAPTSAMMSLCDIHFHENAEHKGGEFTTFAGNGDGHGYGTGFRYDGEFTAAELADIGHEIGVNDHGSLVPGDTIEVHYVYSTAAATTENSLGSCLVGGINNPQLRVEGQVFALVNDPDALDFMELARIENVGGLNQAVNIPDFTGKPITYAGSTTGPDFNMERSPFQVSWSVRPAVAKVNILTLEPWFETNPFNERYAHGVRNLVVIPELLSTIEE